MQTAEHIRLSRSSPLRPALMAVFLLILLGMVWLDARYLQAYRIIWRRELVSYPRSVSGVFYHGGRLYVPDSAGNLFALDAKDGRTLWTFRIGDDWASISPQFVVDGVLYCLAGNAWVYAIDTVSGKKRWAFKLASGGGRLVLDGDVLYATAPDSGMVYALNRHDGKLLWKAELDWAFVSAPIVTPHGLYLVSRGTAVYVAGRLPYALRQDKNVRLHRLNKGTGRVLEEKNLGERFSPLAFDGQSLLLLRREDGTLYRWRPGWQRLQKAGALPARNITPDTCSFLFWQDRLYVTRGREARAYHIPSKRLLWKQPIGGMSHRLGVIGDTLFITSTIPCSEGHFYALDANTGRVKWYLDGKVKRSLPAKGGGMLYFTDSNGGVCAVRER